MAICPDCGSQSADDAHFCAACGAELTVASPREVRKTVTVLFADVTGSTALGEQLDAEVLRRVMARYFDVARAAVERHGGTVEKFIGDAVMAVFGVPTVREDDALRAVRAASEIREGLVRLNTDLDREYGVTLGLRTGVNTGEVVTGTGERLATGDAVNVAARLEQAAEPGEILIGHQTRALALGAIEVVPVTPLALKGKANPVAAYRLVTVLEGRDGFERRRDAPLVGRARELAALRAAFERAVDERRCRSVTVLGPPGIGKSRLVAEVAADLAAEAVVLVGRCLPYGEGITYWPLVEIFRRLDADAELDAVLSAGAPEEISWAVRKALQLRARERPLVLVVEDIHWAEPTLLDLLEHLAEWTRDAPLLLVCPARPDVVDVRPEWGSRPWAETLTLEPLSATESDALVAMLADRRDLDADTQTTIREVSGGNPLFVEQLIARLAEEGDLKQVPLTIQALLAARLDSLSDDERGVLERASVVGLEFDWQALGQLAPDGQRPGGAQLALLVRKELIRPHEVLEDGFRFRHMLIRDAAYERMSKELRADLHERFAAWLEGHEDESDEVIGYHLEQAYRCRVVLGRPDERARGLATRAAGRLGGAGLRAHARGDVDAAVNLLERAIDLYPDDEPERLRLLPSFGLLLRERGQPDRAEDVLSEAQERAAAAGLRGVATDAHVALTDLRFQRTSQSGVVREDVLRVVDASVDVFEQIGDEAGLARALVLGGKLRLWGGEAAVALGELERAAHHAANAGDRAEETESLRSAFVAMRRGPMPAGEALARLEEINATREGHHALETAYLDARAMFEAMLGRFDVARGLLTAATSIADEHGRQVLGSLIGVTAGEVELLAGDPAAAERALRAACGGLEQVGELGFLASAAPKLVEALLAQGRVEEALRLSDRWRAGDLTVPEDADAQIAWRSSRAAVLAASGRHDEAEILACDAVTMAGATDFVDLHGRALVDLAAVLLHAGRRGEAASAMERAIELFERKGNAAAASTARARLARSS